MKNKLIKKIFAFVFSVGVMTLWSCANANYSNVANSSASLSLQYDSLRQLADDYPEHVEIHYAKGLKVDYVKDSIVISISNPESTSDKGACRLVLPQNRKATQQQVTFICTTALQLGNFEVLGMEQRIVGINSLRHIFSEKIQQQIKENKTIRLGKEGNFDVEAVIAARPSYIFVSASKYGGYESLKECGIPLIPHHGYKETNPLGQAEWIKLIGLLTGETRRANAVFSHIEKEYNSLCKKVKEACKGKTLPTVLSGRQVRDGWYVMGGRSYMAQLFHDAGAHYIMSDTKATGGTTLDFESVYARGINADYWQTDGSFDTAFTLDDMLIEDPRYAEIKAFREGKVLFCNFSMTPYRELAAVAPHLMLADFVKAFHPELLPDHKPQFYDFIK